MAGIDGDSSYCQDCVNEKDIDCQYCYKGSKREMRVAIVSYYPTFSVRHVVVKGCKKDQHLLPFLQQRKGL
jgi:hypothetical protein